MSPYKHKFINFVPIQTKVFTAANGGTFDAIGKGDRCLADVAVQNRLYHVEHELRDVAAAADAEVVTIEKLHCLMGHILPDAARELIKKGIVDGFTLDEASKIESCDSCKYGKTHCKAIGKERVAPWASNIGDEVHPDVWGLSPMQTTVGCEYYTTYMDGNSSFFSISYVSSLKPLMPIKHMRWS